MSNAWEKTIKDDTKSSSWENTIQDDTSKESSTLASLLASLTQGATFGLAPKIQGAISAVARPFGVTKAGNQIQDIGTASPTLDLDTILAEYESSKQEAYKDYDKQKADSPILTTGGELVGGFAIPAMGASSQLAKAGITGAAKPILSGAIAGGTGAGLSEFGLSRDGLPSVSDVATSTAIGAGAGAALGVGALGLGKAGQAVANSKFGQDVAKIYNRSKGGMKFLGKESAEKINNEMVENSQKILDNADANFARFSKEYGDLVNNIKIDKPEVVQDKLAKLANDLAEEQIKGGRVDVRKIDAEINALRDAKALNDSEVLQLKQAAKNKIASAKEVGTSNIFKNLDTSKQVAEVNKDTVDTVNQLSVEKRQLQKQLKEMKRTPKSARDLDAQYAIEDQISAIDDALLETRVNTRNTQAGRASDKISTQAEQSATRGIVGDTSDITPRVDELIGENTDINSKIAALLEQKQAGNNTAFSGLLNEMDILAKSAPDTTYGTMKGVNMPSIQSYADQMNRPDLTQKIADILKKAVPEGANADQAYKQQIAILKKLGMGDDSAQGFIKDMNAKLNLTEKLKQAGKSNTSRAANEIDEVKNLIGNEKINTMIDQGVELGENFSLNKKIQQAGLTSPGGYALRGSAIAGEAVKGITENSVIRAAQKLGNSSMGQKLQNILKLEPEAKNRAIFTLSQQPWFRKISEDESK